jgi:hypothetical protein
MNNKTVKKGHVSPTALGRQRLIGKELKNMYNEFVKQPVPDEFLEILGKIDENEEKKTGGKK